MQIILYTVAAIIILIAIIVTVSFFLPQNHTTSQSIELAKSCNSVWEILTNVENYPTWRSDVKSVELIKDTSKITWTELNKFGDTVEYKIQKQEKSGLLITEIVSDGLPYGLPYGGSWTFKIDSVAENKSRITVTENGEVYNPIFRFVSRFILGHTATIKKYLNDLSRVNS